MSAPAVPLGERVSLSVPEAAALLGVTPRRIRELIADGRVELWDDRPGRERRVMRRSLDALAAPVKDVAS